MNNAERRLAMVLDALGETAEDVAHLLEFGGWRGVPYCRDACPVALYLRTVVADATDATVSSGYATIRTIDGEHVEVRLTSAVEGFVLAFDLGVYPLLIDTVTDDNGDVIDDLDR